MRLNLLFWVAAFCGLVTACGGSSSQTTPDINVAPTDFALLPCGSGVGDRPCALVVVGGKRILFGAPAGVTAGLHEDDLRLLDAVMLFSLRSSDIQGLDEVRNRSWDAGRDTPLLVVGPEGVEGFVAGLNKAYEMSDALRVVEDGIPVGGFDSAVLRAHTGRQQTVFDTGDVQVWRTSAGFSIIYRDRTKVWLDACRGDALPVARVHIWCDPERGEHTWPLQQPIFVDIVDVPE
ncbi:MAG: hypothetical protein ACE37M_04640 [Henriciella sp.]